MYKKKTLNNNYPKIIYHNIIRANKRKQRKSAKNKGICFGIKM